MMRTAADSSSGGTQPPIKPRGSCGGNDDTAFEAKNDTAPDLYFRNHLKTALTPFFTQETVCGGPPLSSVGSY